MADSPVGPDDFRPQLPRDDLLSELQSQLSNQVGAIIATRDRLHGLLDAVVAIGADLELPVLLKRITESAVRLVDAEYGALGVIGDDRLSQFVAVGIDDRQRAAIGHLPRGLGLLGLLISDPMPLRLTDLSTHPASAGFPPGHPPMSSFLGVPVRVRGSVFGNLYLTNKRYSSDFSEEDESLVQALATAAGVAIANAHLFAEVRRREAWLSASADVTTALLSGTDPSDALALIVRRARALVSAELATISVPSAAGLVVEFADGDEAPLVLGRTLDLDHSLAGTAFRQRLSINVADATTDTRAAGPAPGQRTYGPTLIVPLEAGEPPSGVLTMSNAPGAARFDSDDETMIESFAGQAAIAMELAKRRREAERLRVYEDRDRIARDLHDLVIQRLFASGMRLESLAVAMTDKDQIDRVQVVVDELDETIREIRSAIYGLHASGQSVSASLRKRLLEIADSASETLGFAPSVRFDGPLDTTVPDHIAEQLVAVLMEALSNVARHARARHAIVVVAVTADAVTMTVSDDGVGIPADIERRSGLANLDDRARRLGGSVDLRAPAPNGLELVWSVPLIVRSDGSAGERPGS